MADADKMVRVKNSTNERLKQLMALYGYDTRQDLIAAALDALEVQRASVASDSEEESDEEEEEIIIHKRKKEKNSALLCFYDINEKDALMTWCTGLKEKARNWLFNRVTEQVRFFCLFFLFLRFSLVCVPILLLLLAA
jgi:hypothetical protein